MVLKMSKKVFHEARSNNKSLRTAAEEAYDGWNGFVDTLLVGMTIKERFLALCGLIFTGILTYVAANAEYLTLFGIISLNNYDGICYPIADALLCAAGIYTPAAYIALIIHAYAVGSNFIFRALLISGIFILRIGICESLRGDRTVISAIFREPPSVKLGSATVLSLICSGIYLLSNGIDISTLPSILTIMLAPPILCVFYCGFFLGDPELYEVGRVKLGKKIYYELSLYSILAMSVYCMKAEKLEFMGCSLAALLTVFFTLVCGRTGGFFRGTLIGAMLGYIYSPSFTASFAIGGAFAGMLSSVYVPLASGIACTAIGVSSTLMHGYSGILYIVQECVIALAITVPVLRYDFLSIGFPFYKKASLREASTVQHELDTIHAHSELQRIYSISNAFSELSYDYKKRFDNAHAREARIPDQTALCKQLCEGICESCPMISICWENQKSVTKDAVKTVCWLLYNPDNTSQTRKPLEFPPAFNCIKPIAFKSEILRICESPELRYSERNIPNTESFSEEYGCVSDMLKSIAEAGEDELECDKEAEKRIARAARSLAFKPSAIAVIGKRKKTVIAYGIDKNRLNVDTDQLREVFSKACGARLGSPDFSDDGIINGGKMTFVGQQRFTAVSAYSEKTKPSESRSGDRCSTFETNNGYFYSVISDGMGSGEDAAESAEIATSIAEKLLSCEIDKELALKMIGSALRRRGNECFATVDLMEIDLMNGSACFLKSGAACSYIIREGSVYCISARSIPIGITAEAIPEQIRFALRDGDTIIMISDGIAQDAEDGAWLVKLMEDNYYLSPEKISELIIEKAVRLRSSSDHSVRLEQDDMSADHDDMTAVVIKLVSAVSDKDAQSAS